MSITTNCGVIHAFSSDTPLFYPRHNLKIERKWIIESRTEDKLTAIWVQVRHLQLQLKNFKDEQSHVQEILHRVKTTAKPVETQDPALPRWRDQNDRAKSPVSSPNNSSDKGIYKHLSSTSTACVSHLVVVRATPLSQSFKDNYFNQSGEPLPTRRCVHP